MSQNFQNQQPNSRRLHSPLLDGYLKTENLKSSLKDKNIVYKNSSNKVLNNKPQNQAKQIIADETIEQVFTQKQMPLESISSELINQNSIDSLDNAFKMAGIFIVAMGSILSLLQLMIIGNSFYNGNYALGSSILILCAVIFGTVLANSLCMGFSHMIKMTRFIYTDMTSQKAKLDEIIQYYNRVNFKSKT